MCPVLRSSHLSTLSSAVKSMSSSFLVGRLFFDNYNLENFYQLIKWFNKEKKLLSKLTIL